MMTRPRRPRRPPRARDQAACPPGRPRRASRVTPRTGPCRGSQARPVSRQRSRGQQDERGQRVNCTQIPGLAALTLAPTARASLTVVAHRARYGATPRRPAPDRELQRHAERGQVRQWKEEASANVPAPSPDWDRSTRIALPSRRRTATRPGCSRRRARPATVPGRDQHAARAGCRSRAGQCRGPCPPPRPGPRSGQRTSAGQREQREQVTEGERDRGPVQRAGDAPAGRSARPPRRAPPPRSQRWRAGPKPRSGRCPRHRTGPRGRGRAPRQLSQTATAGLIAHARPNPSAPGLLCTYVLPFLTYGPGLPQLSQAGPVSRAGSMAAALPVARRIVAQTVGSALYRRARRGATGERTPVSHKLMRL